MDFRSSQPQQLYSHSSQIPEQGEITTQAYIAVDGEDPNISLEVKKIIPAIGFIQKISTAVDYFLTASSFIQKGALIAGSQFVSSEIEGSFTPDGEKLARVATNFVTGIFPVSVK